MSKALALAALLTASALASSASAACEGGLRIVHGRIHTMDAKDTVIASVTIKDAKFVKGAAPVPAACTIDVHGKTVVPGLIDNHNHFILLGERPGHDARLENAASVADVQAALAARARTVPSGGWITAMGGWGPQQLAEKRMPTLVELDKADTAHPLLVYTGFTGPAATNTAGR